MELRRLMPTVAGVLLTATVMSACGSSSCDAASPRSIPKPLLTACAQLDRQSPEHAPAQPGWAAFYDVPPSLALALQRYGNTALQRLGRELVVPGTAATATPPTPSAFDQGQSLCRSLLR